MGRDALLGEGKLVIIPEKRLSIEEPEVVGAPRGRGSEVAAEEVATVLEVRQDISVDGFHQIVLLHSMV